MKIFLKLLFFLFLALTAGCVLEAETPSPSFQFYPNQQVALVAFSIDCAGLGTGYGKLIFGTATDKRVTENEKYTAPISCTLDAYENQVYAYIFTPGNYALTFLRINRIGEEIYGPYHFYFPVQAHKVNYLGRFRMAYIDKNKVQIEVYNENISDIPIVKSIVPEISLKNYVYLLWEKDELGDFIAK